MEIISVGVLDLGAAGESYIYIYSVCYKNVYHKSNSRQIRFGAKNVSYFKQYNV